MAIPRRLRAATTLTLTWIGGALRMGACAHGLNLLNAQRIAAIWPQTMNQCQCLGLTPSRLHQGLSGDTPDEKSGNSRPHGATLEPYAWRSHCHGLFELPIAA